MLHITTNNAPRDIIDASELTTAERQEFDYLNWPALEAGEDSASFFRYRGTLYDLGEFLSSWGLARDGGPPDSLRGWDGYISDSFSSGIVVRYTEDRERVVVGTFYASDED